MSVRIAASPARSAAVTGSNRPPTLLSWMPSEVRKNGRIVPPDTVASSSTNAEKSIAVIYVNTPCLLCVAVAYCCSAVTRLRRVPAALLGRFLPRLGPLAPASGPFSFSQEPPRSLCSRPVRSQFVDRDGSQTVGYAGEVGGKPSEG